MKIPQITMRISPVDSGRAVIGVIDCPNCGKEHLTTHIECGERLVFCGIPDVDNVNKVRPDGYSKVIITTIQV